MRVWGTYEFWYLLSSITHSRSPVVMKLSYLSNLVNEIAADEEKEVDFFESLFRREGIEDYILLKITINTQSLKVHSHAI